jgi:hypothetical protein
MTRLRFRNVGADPSDPVASWPYEALVTAIERGTIGDWVPITAEIDADPWGEVARQVEEYLTYAPADGVCALFDRAVTRARSPAERSEREEVSAEVRSLIEASALSMAQVASRDRYLQNASVDVPFRVGHALGRVDGTAAPGRPILW